MNFWGLEIFASGADQVEEVFRIFGIFEIFMALPISGGKFSRVWGQVKILQKSEAFLKVKDLCIYYYCWCEPLFWLVLAVVMSDVMCMEFKLTAVQR